MKLFVLLPLPFLFLFHVVVVLLLLSSSSSLYSLSISYSSSSFISFSTPYSFSSSSHFSKQFVQTAPHNRLPAKACNLLKIFSSSLKSKYLSMNISVPSEWKVLMSLFTNKMLSHVVNITVLSVSITWCKLWQQFGWQLLYWNAEGCIFLYMPYIHFKSIIYTLLYVGCL